MPRADHLVRIKESDCSGCIHSFMRPVKRRVNQSRAGYMSINAISENVLMELYHPASMEKWWSG